MATPFLINYLFSAKVHVWSVHKLIIYKVVYFLSDFYRENLLCQEKKNYFSLVKNHNGNPAIKTPLINTIKESYQIRFVRIFYLNN